MGAVCPQFYFFIFILQNKAYIFVFYDNCFVYDVVLSIIPTLYEEHCSISKTTITYLIVENILLTILAIG